MILRDTNIRSALRSRQRGFLLNSFRFGAAAAPMPLDSLTTNLWGAYSINQLLSAYAGSAIKVRRSSDSTEQDIGFVSGLLDTTALTTFAGAGDAFVTTLYDQTGNNRNFVQTTSTKQPRIVNGGVYDGFIRYDGVDDGLTRISSPVVTALSWAFKYQFRGAAGNMTLMSLANTNVAGHNTYTVQEENSTTPSQMNTYIFTGGAPNYMNQRWTLLPTGTDATELWVGNRTLANSARSARYRNGSLVAAATTPVNAASAGSFTSETIGLGADPTALTQPATLNLYSAVIWQADVSANAAAIHTALN